MLPPRVSERRVDAVVDHGHHARRVAQERSSPGDGVQHRVQAQLGRRRGRRPVQSLDQTPCSSDGQGREVCRAGSVAEVV